jgi:hypothetical protein
MVRSQQHGENWKFRDCKYLSLINLARGMSVANRPERTTEHNEQDRVPQHLRNLLVFCGRLTFAAKPGRPHTISRSLAEILLGKFGRSVQNGVQPTVHYQVFGEIALSTAWLAAPRNRVATRSADAPLDTSLFCRKTKPCYQKKGQHIACQLMGIKVPANPRRQHYLVVLLI